MTDSEPEMARIDRETRAMREVAKALQGLDAETRARVVRWLMNREATSLLSFPGLREPELDVDE